MGVASCSYDEIELDYKFCNNLLCQQSVYIAEILTIFFLESGSNRSNINLAFL